MMRFHNPQKISVIISLFFVLVLMRLTSESAELKGTVIAVQGGDVTVKIESTGTLQPAIGDILNIMERANEEGNALGIPGKWIITEVNGDIVKAEGKNLLAGLRPRVNMVAFIHISPRSVHAGEAPKVKSEQSSLTAKGKVIMIRGNNVTIQLTKEQPAVYKGDAVELSYSVDDIVIPVGKWRISAINKNGTLEAEPVEMEAQPTIDMDALVFTTTPKETESVKLKKKPDQNRDAITEVTKKDPAGNERATGKKLEKKSALKGETPVKKDPEPKTIQEELSLYYKTNVTQNFEALEKSISCYSGKVQIHPNKIEMKAKGGPKSEYCTLKMSDEVLGNFYATLKISIDITKHNDFKVGIIYGDGIKRPRDRSSDSIFTILSSVGGKVSTGFLKSRTVLVAWIDAYRSSKDSIKSQNMFRKDLPDTQSNPTPGTLEFLKANKKCRVFWNGEEMGSWDEAFISRGQLWIAFSPFTKGKATAVFENIHVYSLHRK
jgi:hypothetical protein